MSVKTIQSYLDFVQKEQDELTLQKNYLSEATLILTSDELKDSYQSFMNCLNKYPSYLFKKEKEFMFFWAKINQILNVQTEDGLKFHDPSMQIILDKLAFKIDVYHTVQGVYELNFSHQDIDMALRLEVDMPNKKIIILSQDLLNLNVDGKAKSLLVHYLTDIMKTFESIDFKVQRETTTNIDLFLMFDKLKFSHAPMFGDLDFDKLFIAMDGTGDMKYLEGRQGVNMVLDEENEAYIENDDKNMMTNVTLIHKQGKIYLFDLLASHPYLEQLFLGEVEFK